MSSSYPLIWENVQHTRWSDARKVDIDGVRLYVRRSKKGARGFTGYINGKWVGTWSGIGVACEKVEETYRRRTA